MYIRNSIVVLCLLLLAGCAQNAGWHSDQVAKSEKNNLTVGSVQRNIRKGMTGGQVAEVLGSPNIVTTDENGGEVWVYDKFYTEGVVSGSNGLTFGLSDVGAGAARTSQSTITVIIKFNKNGQVRDYAYNKSSF